MTTNQASSKQTGTKAKPRKPVAAQLPAYDVQAPLCARVVRLSDPEMEPQMDALKKRIANEPAFGRQLLLKAGIITPKGKLTKRFGG